MWFGLRCRTVIKHSPLLTRIGLKNCSRASTLPVEGPRLTIPEDVVIGWSSGMVGTRVARGDRRDGFAVKRADFLEGFTAAVLVGRGAAAATLLSTSARMIGCGPSR